MDVFRLPRGYRVVIYTHCTFSGCVDVAFQLLCNQGMRVFVYLPHCHGQDTGVDYVPHISADLVPATAGFHKLLEEEHPPCSPMGGVLGSCAQTDRSSNGAEAETGCCCDSSDHDVGATTNCDSSSCSASGAAVHASPTKVVYQRLLGPQETQVGPGLLVRRVCWCLQMSHCHNWREHVWVKRPTFWALCLTTYFCVAHND